MVYLILVRMLRFRRVESMTHEFGPDKRPLSSMTSSEALEIMVKLQTLEFPFSMNKARSVALLKVSPVRHTPGTRYTL